mmetsp:Transcript_42890/g.43458  ORF Transcript_42890/g.43458 Transcript_42890/m.43458 type:complete len:179 (-) Transcript_42890:112-648(-)
MRAPNSMYWWCHYYMDDHRGSKFSSRVGSLIASKFRAPGLPAADAHGDGNEYVDCRAYYPLDAWSDTRKYEISPKNPLGTSCLSDVVKMAVKWAVKCTLIRRRIKLQQIAACSMSRTGALVTLNKSQGMILRVLCFKVVLIRIGLLNRCRTCRNTTCVGIPTQLGASRKSLMPRTIFT